MIGCAEAWLIVDDTALPKKRERSVGIASKYASALGKATNCQTLVSLTRASGGLGGEEVGDGTLARVDLVTWHQGVTEGPLRCRADQAGGRATTADRRHGTAASAGRRGLADGRAPLEWGAQMLSLEPAGWHTAQAPAGAITARWIFEEAHQQLKEELGLDHFERRSWTGFTGMRSRP